VRSEVYAAEAELEADHWWFVGRRELFARLIEELAVDRQSAALDVGTGTGANLALLRRLGFRRAVGLDSSAEAIGFCRARGLGEVRQGDIGALPFADASFDLVLATDVIEHVDDDVGALREIGRVLSPEGHVLLTVPALQALWGLQDELAQHKRRYRRSALLQRMRDAGLQPVRSFYFNSLLLGPIWLGRQLIRVLKPKLRSEAEINSPLLNRLLLAVFRADLQLASRLPLPLGVSILVVARRGN
jgi:SAM-dependent methyltransferase